MKPSLSLLLPVRNAQNSLADQVHRLLELIPDLTNRFEVMIIDDGSNDHTVDVARELMREYPQVGLIRNQKSLGKSNAVRQALSHVNGDVIFVQEQGSMPSPTDLRRLWGMRTDEKLVMPKSLPQTRSISEDLLQRLGMWGQSIQPVVIANSIGSLQAIDRRGVVAQELVVGANSSLTSLQRTDAVRRDESHPEPIKQRRVANGFISHLRTLASGE